MPEAATFQKGGRFFDIDHTPINSHQRLFRITASGEVPGGTSCSGTRRDVGIGFSADAEVGEAGS